MDKSIPGVAAVGLPLLLLVGTSKLTGYHGAAAFTKSLAALGGRFGMIGGAGTLLATGAASGWASEKLFDTASERVIKWRLNQGKSKESIIEDIEKSPFSRQLKDALTYRVQCASK